MFVYQPRAEVDRAHEKQEKELGEEIANLVKKVCVSFVWYEG